MASISSITQEQAAKIATRMKREEDTKIIESASQHMSTLVSRSYNFNAYGTSSWAYVGLEDNNYLEILHDPSIFFQQVEECDYEHIEEPDTSFEASIRGFSDKTKGKNFGIIMEVPKLGTYYIKTHSGWEGLEKGTLCSTEFFTYKLLELLGFGPKTEFVPDLSEEKLPQNKKTNFFIATLDAAYTKRDKLKERGFVTGGFEEFVRVEKTHPNASLVTYNIAIDILDYCLNLFDSLDNPDNAGLVTTRKREAPDTTDFVHKKPKIIDFTLVPTRGERMVYRPRYENTHVDMLEQGQIRSALELLLIGQKHDQALIVAMKKAYKYTCDNLIRYLDSEIYPKEQDKLQKHVLDILGNFKRVFEKYSIDPTEMFKTQMQCQPGRGASSINI